VAWCVETTAATEVPVLALVQARQVAPGRPQVGVAQRRLDLADLGPGVLQRPRERVAQRMHRARAQALLAQVGNRPRRQAMSSRAIAGEEMLARGTATRSGAMERGAASGASLTKAGTGSPGPEAITVPLETAGRCWTMLDVVRAMAGNAEGVLNQPLLRPRRGRCRR
jgi:hypothetical protein